MTRRSSSSHVGRIAAVHCSSATSRIDLGMTASYARCTSSRVAAAGADMIIGLPICAT